LILQVFLGGYIYRKKIRKGFWFKFHRMLAFILVIAILIHIL